MAPVLLTALTLASVASAIPQFTLPPLIPRIPGVTVPLAKNAPPLPILQPPTPPLPSPKHKVNSKLRPKRLGFIWTGTGQKEYKDFLAGYSLDDDTFGTLLSITEVPSSGNEPHHSGPSADGKYIWGGGLLSLLKTQDTGYYFDTSNPYKPKYIKSDRATLSSIADDFIAKPDGGFFYTYMGSAIGTTPGRLVETDANYNIIHQWPEDQQGLLNVLSKQFSPHGLNIDFKRGHILTSDFVVPRSVLKPTAGVQGADTLRLWDLKTRTIINTLTIPGGNGIQDVKFIPGNPEAAAVAMAVGLGEAWIIYPERKDRNGKKGTIERFITLPKETRDSTAIFSSIDATGSYLYITSTDANHVYQYNIKNLKKPVRLDKGKTPTIGPHFIKVAPDNKHVAVFDYFVQTGQIGVLNPPADYKVWYADINKDGSLSWNKSINFEEEFVERGGGRPHSISIFDLSNPKAPKYF